MGAAFRAAPGVTQSVLSGNILPNAIIKLAVFGLDGFMDFEAGGYGSDDEERPALVAVAQRRAAIKYAELFTVSNTVLIGDTPRVRQRGRPAGRGRGRGPAGLAGHAGRRESGQPGDRCLVVARAGDVEPGS